MKKLFGGINLTWTKLIISAIIAGVYTGLVALSHKLLYTSFHTITATLEVWILFGIIIIMNSKSAKDSALKCFVFFLISQPLVYLIQVPFSVYGWGMFKYYPFWGAITVLCLPMGYIGYNLKKDKWWNIFILYPMIFVVGLEYSRYLSDFMFYYPFFSLITIFCLVTMIIYPIYTLKNKIGKTIYLILSISTIIFFTITTILKPPVYNTYLSTSGIKEKIENIKEISLDDSKYGILEIEGEGADAFIHAKFKKAGKTTFTVKTKDGKTSKYNIDIKRTTYNVTKYKK